jgi:hypothetical protein
VLLVSRTLREVGIRLDCIVSASGVGYYGAVTNDKIFVEEDKPHAAFLGRTCHAWENAISYVTHFSDREIRFRTGVVLMKEGGALPKLLQPAKLGLGAPLGSGRQWVPWIHIDDLIEMYLKALTDQTFRGPINAVAPEHVSQSKLIKEINLKLSKPNFLPNVPGMLMRLIFGQMAAIILEGSRISSMKLLNSEFKFQHETLDSALRNLIK